MTIGPGGVKKMYAVIMPNEEDVHEPVNTFVTTVREVEEKTGFDFFASLPAAEQARMETAKETFDESLTKKAIAPKKKAKPVTKKA